MSLGCRAASRTLIGALWCSYDSVASLGQSERPDSWILVCQTSLTSLLLSECRTVSFSGGRAFMIVQAVSSAVIHLVCG